MNLIYMCVFHQQSYINLLKLLITSISVKGNINKDTTDILIITSPSFQLQIQNELQSFELPLHYYIINLNSLMESSCCKLKIFSYSPIDKYQKILYLDTDVLVNSDINLLFNNEISSDKLYALEEGNIGHEYWGSQFFDFTKFDKAASAFSAGVFYFMNSLSMKKLFEDVNTQINNYVGKNPVCLDQPFLVFNSFIQEKYNNQFMKKYLENNPKVVDNEKIIYHFPGAPGNYSSKFAKMTSFWGKITAFITPLKLKILVIMSDNRKLSQENNPQDFWSNTAYINKNYCDKFGYDFKYINPYYKENTNNLYSCIDMNTYELRHSAWSKIPIMLNALDKKYEYIVYIDSDCVFRNFNISIEEKIQQYKESPLIFQSNFPWHPKLPCTGFYIVKNSPENITFLNKWYNYKLPTYNSTEWQNTLRMAKTSCSYDWVPGKHWEQDALWSMIANNLSNVTVDISEVALEEHKGQYVRHVCSVESNNRNKYFTRVVTEMIANNFPSYNSIIKSIHAEEVDTAKKFSIFDTRNDMLKFYCDKVTSPKILEIGVFKGEFLHYLEKNCSWGSIDAVDLFEGITCSGDVDGNNVVYQDVGKSYLELLEKYKEMPNIKIHKSNSIHFLTTQEDNTYDIIYIDGDHSYEGVKQDLTNAFRKIKNGGYIMGHDYEMNMKKTKNHYNFGTKQAVGEFCLTYNQTIISKALDGCVSFCIHIKF